MTAERNPYESWSDEQLEREHRKIDTRMKKLAAELATCQKQDSNIRLTKLQRRAEVNLSAANSFGYKGE